MQIAIIKAKAMIVTDTKPANSNLIINSKVLSIISLTSFMQEANHICLLSFLFQKHYTKNTGWYYNSIKDRSPSWSGVEFLHNFLITNKGPGPTGKIVESDKIQIGDIVQLRFEKNVFEHTLIVVNIEDAFDLNNIYTASHTYDSFNRRVSTYKFEDIRFIHINNIAIW